MYYKDISTKSVFNSLSYICTCIDIVCERDTVLHKYGELYIYIYKSMEVQDFPACLY